MTETPRFLPDVPFPPYTYVPGQTPHPVSDPAGHMYGDETEPAELQVDDWPRCHAYLRGIDLFNHGYYWESHEVWESLWHAAGRQGPIADFLKGLIKLAAAGVKTREGSENGRSRHSQRAAELFRSAGTALKADNVGREQIMGLSLDSLAIWSKQTAASEGVPSSANEQVCPVLSFVLIPQTNTSLGHKRGGEDNG